LTTPASFGYNYLRPNFLIKILENASFNLKNFNEFKIFETGKIFRKENKLPIETLYLAGAIVGKNQENNFLQLKGSVSKLFEILNIQNLTFENGVDERFEEFLKISVNHQELGILGNISNNYQKIYDLKTKVAYFELNLEKLINFYVPLKLFSPLLKFPKAKRDLSIWMPQNLTFSQVKEIIENSSKLLKEIKVFDSIKIDSKKSYSFHLEFFDETRTLTEEEVEKEMAKIIDNLNKLNIEIR
jgi:phenylalanyl-tRNA synthetase beta chain